MPFHYTVLEYVLYLVCAAYELNDHFIIIIDTAFLLEVLRSTKIYSGKGFGNCTNTPYELFNCTFLSRAEALQ